MQNFKGSMGYTCLSLSSLYKARVAFLRKKLDDERMSEGEPMDAFLTRIKDLQEQIITIDEIIPDASLTLIVLRGLPDPYQSFATTLCLLSKNNPNT